MNNDVYKFKEAIVQSGLNPPDQIIDDGKFHRFSVNGKRSNKNGWYVFNTNDFSAGSFGDWSTGFQSNWKANIGREYSRDEVQRIRERTEQAKRDFEIERIKSQREAQSRAQAIWNESAVATDHPYLTRKEIPPCGARQNNGDLIIPLFDDEIICSIQFIKPDGGKKFLKDGKKKGCFYSFGTFGTDDIVCLCEGFSTGASIHQATGYPVIVAFDAGNLEPVGQYLRGKFPTLRIVVCADDDWKSEGNVGLTKAKACAKSIGAYLTIPIFEGQRMDKDTDFNDMARVSGLNAVKEAIDAVLIKEARDLWGDPIDLPAQLPVQGFDYALLPEAFRPWIEDISNRMQCSPDFPAIAAIICASSLIGAKAAIQPKDKDTKWQVIPNLWGMIIGRAGVMKSPPVKEVMGAISELEKSSRQEYESKLNDWKMDLELAELTKTSKKKQAQKLFDKGDKTGARAIMGEPEEMDKPICSRYIVNDSSVESLQVIMSQNPWGVLCFRDEIYGLLKSMDKQGQEGARAFYLTSYDGNQAYSTDRIGRDDVVISRACLSMLGTIQPSRLDEYIRGAVQGGSGDDGLLQRFGLMVHPDSIDHFRYVDKNPDSEAKDKAHAIYIRLSQLQGFADEPIIYKFTPEAQSLFLEWYIPFSQELMAGDNHPALESHLSKYRKLIPALALIFALIDAPSEGCLVGAIELGRALDWCEYLRSHAERIYQSASVPETSSAKAIIRKIKSKELLDGFSTRELSRKNWSGLNDLEVVKKALNLLVEHNYLRYQGISTGGRSSEQYFINPKMV
ncbi:DUF3987 domain-containing protein [Polynucleobacter antarcticus]|uniref:Toprim domain-containing protein n=1 Tax=Polynucleobacter antarcticus TaxID=1743162 RepID=A0A6M9PYL6_9BURK|nr:DUF3987 domain-containing protein [Polynucleobacter antarcticus]QKM62946.1 hypothetical protein DCO16_07680 [Polynucleobacter antarcticus]